MFTNISYFETEGIGLCQASFKNEDCFETININCIESLSDLQMFYTPLSGKAVALFATLIMVSGRILYIRENEYHRLISIIAKS